MIDNKFDGATTPPTTPLPMPRRELNEARIPLRQATALPYTLTVAASRLFVLILTVALAFYGVSEIYGVLSANSITPLQWVFLLFFSINFIWIAYAFAQALLGFLVSLSPTINRPQEAKPDFKTAILLPIYNEDPARIYAAVEAMRSALIEKAPNDYAFFILSDSNRPESWLQEESILSPLFTHDPVCPVYYRKRSTHLPSCGLVQQCRKSGDTPLHHTGRGPGLSYGTAAASNIHLPVPAA